MSAIISFGGKGADLMIPEDHPGRYRFSDLGADCFQFGELFFYEQDWHDDALKGQWVGFAFDGQIPEIAIPNYIGAHPERLVEGFTASDKPDGCAWMANSRIKSIVNHMGSVLVELEPAGAVS